MKTVYVISAFMSIYVAAFVGGAFLAAMAMKEKRKTVFALGTVTAGLVAIFFGSLRLM